MSIAPTLTELAEQLDVAVTTLDAETLSAEDAATLLPLLSSLQRQFTTLVSFTDARVDGDNIHFLDQKCRTSAEQTASTPAPFEYAMVSGDTFTYGSDFEQSTWEDGRRVEWVGSQCIVR